jgi:hypothetical protein
MHAEEGVPREHVQVAPFGREAGPLSRDLDFDDRLQVL